jgi:hypothetical protein
MFTLHCTRKLLDRIHPELVAPCSPTTGLGNWYATALFWKPQMALLVNERTLLPVVMPLAPAATLAKRFPAALKDVLQALDLPADFIQAEIDGMGEVVYAKTANRSLVGMLNEFSFLGEAYRDRSGHFDPLALSLKLAGVPCGPLSKGAGMPNLAVRDVVAGGGLH